ncbi:glycosyl hydrolase [Verrucomicrobiaceae bacterium SCGC AG-212-N21]|nr:glycosyl hydrolase [Verrucomicrobiaceae bacterium SCGC AG-212-N21]
MKQLTLILLSLALTVFSQAQQGPIRVLFVDSGSSDPTGPLHEAMRDLGRDAIWFDHATSPGDSKSLYDVVLDAKDAGKPEEIRAKVLAALTPERKAAYEAFLAQREPEKREPHPMIANYEKRPEPITFQHPMSVKGSMERTQVPADCELRLFASEPDIRKPIAMAWDERGRCWVAETSDYPHGLVEDGRGHDSIRICEDTDGDGKADKFTVFADKLNIPTAIVFVNGGIIVSQPPRFLFLKDTDGDDKADVRQDIISGYGIRDTHAQASNLHYGIDNWIYGCVGYSGFEGIVNGQSLSFTMGTYRLKPDGSALAFLHQFTNNAWAHSENDSGDQFGGTANGAPLFFGGIPATHYPKGMRGMTAKKINEVDLCHTITPNFRQVDVFGGYTAAAGSAFIYSDNLPKRFQGKVMVCEPTMKLISLMDVQNDGAGYTAKDAWNLVASSDEWMSPVFAEVGPDGAVWFADFQNFIIQHNPTPSVERGGFKGQTGVGGAHMNDLRDHERGRIYRVVAKAGIGHPARIGPAIVGDTPWERLTAQRLMLERGDADVAALAKQVVAQDSGIAAIHALWTLHGLGKLNEATHKAALLAKDPKLRRNAIRALGNDTKAHDLFFGAGVITDPDLHTRLAAFVKLAEFPTTPEVKTLVFRLSLDPIVQTDEWLREAARLLMKKHDARAFKEGPNLLTNGDLEKLGTDGLPEGWTRRDYNHGDKIAGNKGAEWKVLSGEGKAHGGASAIRCITRADGDTSLYQDVPLKPNTTYRLSGWVKTHALRGKVSFNDHIGRAETDKDTSRESDWNEVEVVFTNKDKPKASINILHVGKGDGYFDDVKLCELLPDAADEDKPLAGDVKRGENIFWTHPVAACKNCHLLKGQGSAVGPALDGIASRKDEAYLIESLMNPNAKLAEGYTATPISPMPPLNLILKPQEFADVKAFLFSLKEEKK